MRSFKFVKPVTWSGWSYYLSLVVIACGAILSFPILPIPWSFMKQGWLLLALGMCLFIVSIIAGSSRGNKDTMFAASPVEAPRPDALALVAPPPGWEPDDVHSDVPYASWATFSPPEGEHNKP